MYLLGACPMVEYTLHRIASQNPIEKAGSSYAWAGTSPGCGTSGRRDAIIGGYARGMRGAETGSRNRKRVSLSPSPGEGAGAHRLPHGLGAGTRARGLAGACARARRLDARARAP
jgi:hypothetical protein